VFHQVREFAAGVPGRASLPINHNYFLSFTSISKLRSYFFSASFEKKHAGNSSGAWFATHSQHLPWREQVAVQGHESFILLSQAITDTSQFYMYG